MKKVVLILLLMVAMVGMVSAVGDSFSIWLEEIPSDYEVSNTFLSTSGDLNYELNGESKAGTYEITLQLDREQNRAYYPVSTAIQFNLEEGIFTYFFDERLFCEGTSEIFSCEIPAQLNLYANYLGKKIEGSLLILFEVEDDELTYFSIRMPEGFLITYANDHEERIATIEQDYYGNDTDMIKLYIRDSLGCSAYVPFENHTLDKIRKLEYNKCRIEAISLIQQRRVSTLETWKETISETIIEILSTITGLVTQVDALEDCCNGLPTGAGTWQNFKNYIRSSTRKKMVCDYAEAERLEHIEELGYSCDLTYKTYRSGRERVRCRCKRV